MQQLCRALIPGLGELVLCWAPRRPAAPAQIKRAYRSCCKQSHPDLVAEHLRQGAEQRMQARGRAWAGMGRRRHLALPLPHASAVAVANTHAAPELLLDA